MLAPADRDLPADVIAWLEPHADAMAELVLELVVLETENPPVHRRCAEVLREAMTGLRMAAEIVDVAGRAELEDPCVVIGSVGDGPETVYYHGHFDVVPAQSRDQFSPRRAGGTITGRGSADMKGGL